MVALLRSRPWAHSKEHSGLFQSPVQTSATSKSPLTHLPVSYYQPITRKMTFPTFLPPLHHCCPFLLIFHPRTLLINGHSHRGLTAVVASWNTFILFFWQLWAPASKGGTWRCHEEKWLCQRNLAFAALEIIIIIIINLRSNIPLKTQHPLLSPADFYPKLESNKLENNRRAKKPRCCNLHFLGRNIFM